MVCSDRTAWPEYATQAKKLEEHGYSLGSQIFPGRLEMWSTGRPNTPAVFAAFDDRDYVWRFSAQYGGRRGEVFTDVDVLIAWARVEGWIE